MRKLSLGIIGAGGIARRRAIPAILKAKNCTLSAVMNPSSVEDIAKQFSVPRAYKSVDEILADPEIEAVYIASPVFLHRNQVVAAAEQGKHILCEKPLARSLAEAKELVAACRENRVFLQEAYMMTFHGAHRKIHEIIQRGLLGKIVSMRAQLSCWYPPMAGAWRQHPKTAGGGALIDMATHLYDLLEYFAGPIRRIAALTGNIVHDYNSEDASTTLLEFESGTQATIDCFFCIPDKASRTRLEIYGSRGSIFSEGTIGQDSDGSLEGILGLEESAYDAQQDKDGACAFSPIGYETVNPYTAEFEYFAERVLAKQPPAINTAKRGLHILELVEAAYASSASGRIIELN